jgi:hypothetical protein
MTVTLRAGSVVAEVDTVGAEVGSLRAAGREMLFRSPWSPRRLVDRGVDDTSWVEGWRGGWALLFPNAGPGGVLDGVPHPYHGEAALTGWDVVEQDDGTATLSTTLAGTTAGLLRRFALDRRSLTVTTRIENVGDRPLRHVVVEHLILGGFAVEEGARVDLPSGDLRILDERSTPRPWDRVPAGPAMWFGVVRDACGPAFVTSADGGFGVRVDWDRSALPHLWVWLEQADDAAPPWAGRVRCLGLEPASTLVPRGVAVAAETGDASVLAPGHTLQARVTVTVEPGDR